MNKGGTPENLKPFKQGYDPRRENAGRPKGSISIPALLDNLLDGITTIKDTGEKLTKREAMALMQIQKALTGDTAAFKEIVDRLEGKPIQKNINEGNMNITWESAIPRPPDEKKN